MPDETNHLPLSRNTSPADPERLERRNSTDHEQTLAFAVEAANLLKDLHCEDLLLLDVRGLSDVTDFILIGSGTSKRQIRSLGDDVEKLAKGRGLSRFGRDQDEDTTWVVLDFVDAVVHLFEPTTRAHYDLEMMWDDAPRVDWKRHDRPKRQP